MMTTLSSTPVWLAILVALQLLNNHVWLTTRTTALAPTYLPKQKVTKQTPFTTVASATTDNDSDGNTRIWTREQLEEFCDKQGVIVSISTLGPGYRVLARAKHNTTQILGYIEGFVRPGNTLLHVDKMEVFRKMLKTARKENPDEFKGGGVSLGVGMLMGYLCMLHGKEQGCVDAEFLAIDDEDFQHKRLVRYYQNAGFDVIKYVGDDFVNIPDRLVWGGCGTLLRKDINHLLQFWSSLMEKSVKMEKENQTA